MRRYLLVAAGLMAVLALGVAFALAAPYVPREMPDRGVLPADEPQVKGEKPGMEKGWEIDLYDNPVKLYTPENLYLYLKDKANRYGDYGFVKLTHGLYRPGLNDKPQVVVDAYEMSTPLGAYGLLTQERTADMKLIDVGAGATSISAKECVFWKGSYFVRVSLLAELDNAEEVLTKFAKTIATNIKGVICVPELAWFPSDNRSAAGDAYVVRELLGYPCLGRGFTVQYDVAGAKATMFLAIIPAGTVIRKGDKEKVTDAHTSYLDVQMAMIKDGSTPQVLPGPWDDGFRATDPKLGRGLVVRTGNYIVGIFGTPDDKKTDADMVTALVKLLK